MDFNFTKEQILLKQSVKEFTLMEIDPLAGEIDRSSLIPDHLIKKIADLNLLGMTLPAEFGGSNVGNLECLLAVEQLSCSGTGIWWLAAFANSIPECIIKYGTQRQKEKYLSPVCKGLSVPSIQFTEADTGSDPDAIITTATEKGDDYLINGMKRFSTFGARDGFSILYAIDEAGLLSAFIVKKNTPGYSVSNTHELMGGGGIETVDVYFDDLALNKENLLGTKGDGFSILQYWIAIEKIQQCGACIGIAAAAIDEAKKYASLRMVKKKPMAKLPSTKSMLAEMYSRLEAARWLTYRAAFLKDINDPAWLTEAAAAKIFVVPAAMDIVEMSRRIHGAYGYTRELKIERLYRAVAGASAIAVSLEINRAIVASAMVKKK